MRHAVVCCILSCLLRVGLLLLIGDSILSCHSVE